MEQNDPVLVDSEPANIRQPAMWNHSVVRTHTARELDMVVEQLSWVTLGSLPVSTDRNSGNDAQTRTAQTPIKISA